MYFYETCKHILFINTYLKVKLSLLVFFISCMLGSKICTMYLLISGWFNQYVNIAMT